MNVHFAEQNGNKQVLFHSAGIVCYFQVKDWIHKFQLWSRASNVHITSPWFSTYHISACFSDWMTKSIFTTVKTHFPTNVLVNCSLFMQFIQLLYIFFQFSASVEDGLNMGQLTTICKMNLLQMCVLPSLITPGNPPSQRWCTSLTLLCKTIPAWGTKKNLGHIKHLGMFLCKTSHSSCALQLQKMLSIMKFRVSELFSNGNTF